MDLSKLKENLVNNKWTICIIAVLLLAAFACGRFLVPAKVVETVKYQDKIVTKTETQIQYVDRIVEKKIYVKDTAKDKSVDKTTTEVINKDGSKVITVTEHSDSKTDEHVSSKDTKTDDKQINQTTKTTTTDTVSLEKTKTIENNVNNWRVGVGAGVEFSKFQLSQPLSLDPMVYSFQLDHRIIGPFWLGVQYQTNNTVTLQLGGIF